MNTQLKLLIIGGYGEFGGRLARLLLRDNHSVIVAGRSLDKATEFCQQYGGTPEQFDTHTDLASLDKYKVDVVVDAAGPFQSYGEDTHRYRVVIAALKSGAHYLDLSDDGEFTKDIVSIDSLAKECNRFALSGVSSTPALSGAAVTAMLEGFKSIEKIESTILPGGRAPKGYSVMWAILNQVGNPTPFWRSGEWVDCIGWSEPVNKTISNSIDSSIKRDANLISTADVVLFPKHFKSRTVLFRAGLSQTIMHKSVQWLGALRHKRCLPVLTRFISPLTWLANSISFIGSDNGGMLVEVIGHSNDKKAGLKHKSWTLLAEPGEGPYVPAVAARALLRNIDKVPIGARACIDELPLGEFVEAMSDIGIQTDTQHSDFKYLFQAALQEQWSSLPEAMRDTHAVVDRMVLSGTAKITRGTSLITGLIASLFRFPKAVESIPVTVTKTRLGNKEVWWRDFGGQRFKSTLRPVLKRNTLSAHTVEEQFGLMKFVLQLPVRDGVMHMNVVSGRCLGIPIPSILLPISNTTEFVKDGRMNFSVEIRAPLNLGLIVLYEGSLS